MINTKPKMIKFISFKSKTLITFLCFIIFISLFTNCRKNVDINAGNFSTEKEWIHTNGGIYKDETLAIKSNDGTIKVASLDWVSLSTFKIGEVTYTEIPFNFHENMILSNADYASNTNRTLNVNENVSFSLLIRNINGKIEAAVKFTQRNVILKNASNEKLGTIEGYSNLEGLPLNIWFTDGMGKLSTMSKQIKSNISTNGIKVNSAFEDLGGGGGCSSFSVSTYEYHCWITGGQYNETACGWQLVATNQYIVCNDGGGGSSPGGAWPPSSGGDPQAPPPIVPTTPCNGDALANPSIAPSSIGNKNGGRFGPTRINPDGTPKYHYGIDLAAVPNTPVYAAYSGMVTMTVGSHPSNYYGSRKSFGNIVEIESTLPDGKTVKILYAHLNSVSVSIGSMIMAGTQIGLSGKTGNAQNVFSPHVHVQMTDESTGKKINPENYLSTKFDSQGNSTGRPCN